MIDWAYVPGQLGAIVGTILGSALQPTLFGPAALAGVFLRRVWKAAAFGVGYAILHAFGAASSNGAWPDGRDFLGNVGAAVVIAVASALAVRLVRRRPSAAPQDGV